MLRRYLHSLVVLVLAGFAFGQGAVRGPGIPLGTFTATQAVQTSGNPSAFKWALSPIPINPNGTLFINPSNIDATGSSNCIVRLLFAGSSITAFPGTFAAFNGPAIAVNLGNPPTLLARVSAGSNAGVSFTTVSILYQCVTYPRSGTLTYEFVPDATAENSYGFQHISSGLTGCIPLKPIAPGGQLHTVVINQAGTGVTLTLYDNTTCTGTGNQIIAVLTGFATGQTFLYDIATVNGFSVNIAGTPGDYTITFR